MPNERMSNERLAAILSGEEEFKMDELLDALVAERAEVKRLEELLVSLSEMAAATSKRNAKMLQRPRP